jgi:uncharacterized membrane protein HdeD (DUF308 family)
MSIPTPGGPWQGNAALVPMGLCLLGLGIAAMLVPSVATIAVEQITAGFLLVSGAAGIGFALSLRPAVEWRMPVALFAMLTTLGFLFLLFPTDGTLTLTMLLALVFLVQGCAAISIGIGLRKTARSWGLIVLSGVGPIGMGCLIVSRSPDTAVWALGLLTGLNLAGNGCALLMLGMISKPGDRT